MLKSLKIFLFTCGLAIMPMNAAVVLFDNLGSPVQNDSYPDGSFTIGTSFGVDGGTYSVTSVKLKLQQLANTALPVVSIWSDSGFDAPLASIGTLLSPTLNFNVMEVATFTSPGIALTPNSKYWVVLDVTGGGQIDWVGGGGAISGVNNIESHFEFNGAYYNSYPRIMQVNANESVTATPEPGTLGVLLSGATVLFAVRRRLVG